MQNVLIITGASRGIGAATAQLAAKAGWSVVTSYLERREPAEAVVKEINAAGGQAITVQADTSIEADVVRLFDTAEKQFGKVTGLVNNAGINTGANNRPTRVGDMEISDVRRMFDINVIGCFICAREAVRRMSTDTGGPGGVIVNLGSVAARLGSPNERVHYAASKGAIISMTTGLAREVIRNGIRVNCVSPGLTETEMNKPERVAAVVPGIPIARIGDPMEIARAIMFLLSPESSYIVGDNITVSGGR